MDVRELLDECGVRYRAHGDSSKVSEGWVGVAGPCPFCSHGPNYCGIHLRSGRVSCWSCGRHTLADVLIAAAGVPVPDARRLAGTVTTVAAAPAPHRGKLVLPDPLVDLLPAHRHYLERRGFDPDELAAVWGVRGIGHRGGVGDRDLRWRVYVPFVRGFETVSWTTRSIDPGCPPANRYYAASAGESAVPRGELLFGEQHARHAVIACEGPFDAMAVGPGAVATAGTGVSRAQTARIAAKPIRAIVFDNEPAAQRRARALADSLSVYPGETYVVQLSGPDPASSPKSEIAELRRRFLD